MTSAAGWWLKRKQYFPICTSWKVTLYCKWAAWIGDMETLRIMGELMTRKTKTNSGAICDCIRLYANVTTHSFYDFTPQCYISFHLTSHWEWLSVIEFIFLELNISQIIFKFTNALNISCKFIICYERWKFGVEERWEEAELLFLSLRYSTWI